MLGRRYALVIAALLLVTTTASGTTISVPGDYTTIQAAVDAAVPADVIVIAAGEYTEQVHIQTSDITLSGAGVDFTTIKSPATLVDYFTTSYNHYPIVLIDGVTGVTISELTVDGDKQGGANYKFEGVSFWNSGGALTDVDVVGVMDDPFSGAQHGVGIYSFNNTGGPYNIALTDVLVEDYQKTAVALLGDGLTVDLTRVITIGQGATDVTAQNGIQTGYGSGGTLTDCEVYDNWYTGDTWTASGFLPQIGSVVDVTGGILDGNQTGVYTYDVDCAMTDCDVTGCPGSAVIAYASGAKAGSGSAPLLPSPIAEEYTLKGARSAMSFTADECTFTGTDVLDEAGIYPYGAGDVLSVTISNSDLSHWDYAVFAYEDGGTIDLTLHGNSFHDNGSYAAYVVTASDQDFEENWWGDAAGPSPDAKAGGAVNDKVDYSPWYAAHPGTSPMPIGTDDSIQDAINAAAPGATINVSAGHYTEALLINKPLTLLGATAADSKNGYTVPPDYAWDPGVESIISHPNPAGGYNAIVDIYDVSDVTFKGFVVEELDATANLNVSLVRVYALTSPISDIVVENNVIGPNTRVSGQDGTHGRMGLYLVNHPYTEYGITNSSFSHNKLFDCKGNGDNVFLWTSYYAYGAPGPASMAGTVIDDNEIYGSHRSGIETAGGFSDLTISNNEIYGSTGLPGDDPDFLKYGHGIQLIRGSSDKVSNPETAYGPVDLTIIGNHIHDNQKNGIYMGPKNDGIVITDNVIHDNGWDGVMVDLAGNYWNPQFEDPPMSEQYACYDCSSDISGAGNSIYDNGLAGNPIAGYGIHVNGTPTNGLIFEGALNWWGDADGPSTGRAQDAVSDHVDYSPWYAAAPGTYPMPLGTDDSIQDAVYAADPGATVTVSAGIYNESVTIDRSVDLLGEDGAVIDGAGLSDEGVFIDAGEVTLDNFEIRNFSSAGGVLLWVGDDYFDGWTDVAITNNKIHDVGDDAWGFGIYVGTESERLNPGDGMYDPAMTDFLDFTGLTISGNEIYNTSGASITLQALKTTGDMLDISGNYIHDSAMSGIWIDSCRDLSLEANHIDGNVTGIFISGYADGYYEGTPNGTYDPQNITVSHNFFDGNGSDIKVYDLTCDALSFNYNMFDNTTDYGIFNYITSCMIDGEYNWWGDPAGPSVPGPRSGAGVTEGVDYDPWLGGNVYCDPEPQVISLADYIGGVYKDDVVVKYLGGGSGDLWAYSMDVAWDNTVVSAVLTDFSRPNNGPFSTMPAFLFQVRELESDGNGLKKVRIDAALGGTTPGTSGPCELFKGVFTAVGTPDYATSAVGLTIQEVRDSDNQDLTGFLADSGEVIVDLVGPAIVSVSIENDTVSPVTGSHEWVKDTDDLTVYATITDGGGLASVTADVTDFGGGDLVEPDVGTTYEWTLIDVDTGDANNAVSAWVTATDTYGNITVGSDDMTADNTLPTKVTGFAAAPAHEEVVLSWANASGTDDNYYGVLVRYAAWGDYPLYDRPAPVDYPGDETEGDGEVFFGDDIGATHNIELRDIYYYSAFACDWALNIGPVDEDGQDRATNYWLGDVANVNNDWEPDGYVSDPDIVKLSGIYGGAPSGDLLKCDVGPTDDHSRVGIPEPDDFIDFEDLMMFAMNYDVVSPKIVPFLDGEPDSELMLTLREIRFEEGLVQIALNLAGNAGEVKGLSATIGFDSSGLEFVSAAATDDMSSPLAPVFFWSGATEREVQVDFAVLGTGVTIGGSGDVAVLTFRALGGSYNAEFENAVLRGAENENLTADLEDLESKPEIPNVFRLVQNSPNPFNPVTTVAYHVPHKSEVTIRVYDVAGRLVRTLVDGLEEPGVHEAAWDGRSDRGQSVGSGVYFCVMEADGFRDSRKMTLLK